MTTATSVAVSTVTSIASVVAAPAAAQTLRAISLVGIISMAERCKLRRQSDPDDIASAAPQWPESLLPSLAISVSEDDLRSDPARNKTETDFALAYRRGALIANAFIAPVVFFAFTLFVGLVRRRFGGSRLKDASIFAAGCSFGLTPSITGSLAADGVFASATVLLTVPGGPMPGDVALAVMAMLTVVGVVGGCVGFCFRSIYRNNQLVAAPVPDTAATAEDGPSAAAAAPRPVPISCEPMVIRTKGDAKSAAEPRGIMWLLFGSETWTGDVEIVERYRQCFATTRGLRVGGDRESWSRVKVLRRCCCTASFAVEVVFLIFSAVGRGYGLTRPCEASDGAFNVNVCLFVVAMLALLFSVWTRAPISPLRCLAEISANVLLAASSFALLLLGPTLKERLEAGAAIQRTALAAAFLVTSCTLLSVFARIFLIRLRRREIVANSRAEADHRAGVIPVSSGLDADTLLAEILLLPFGGDDDSAAPSIAPHQHHHHHRQAPPASDHHQLLAELQREEIDFSQLDDQEELLPPVSGASGDGGAAGDMSEEELQAMWASLDEEESS